MVSSRCSSTVSNRGECDQCCDSPNNQLVGDFQSDNNSVIIDNSDINLRFPIYVESMTGTTFKLDVFPLDTIRQIKEQLENTEGIPVCQQHLIWKYSELTNEMSVQESNICFGSRLQLVLDITTGPLSRVTNSLNFNENLNANENSNEDPIESRPLTILLFQNGDQIKVISITTNNTTNILDPNQSNNSGSETDLSDQKTVTNEKTDYREEEDRLLKNKINQIQNQMKGLDLKRKKYNLNAKQNDNKEPLNCEKLPNLDNKSTDFTSKQFKSQRNPELHLPPIPIASPLGLDSKPNENSLNDSTIVEKQNNFIKQISDESIDTKTVLNNRRHSLTSNRIDSGKQSEDQNLLNLLSNTSIDSITRLRPLTAPVFNGFGDIGTQLISTNYLYKTKPPIKRSNNLVKQKNSAKTNRLKSGRKLPPIVNNSKKKVNKIRCSLCRIKLGIVNRYKCRCGLIFCAKHRYSETHFCTYDYKEEGKNLIKQNNPIIRSDKLPKI